MSTGRRILWRLGMPLMVAASFLWTPLALAAAPPTPSLRKTSPAWVGYAVIFLLLVVVMVVSLLPSKRSHQN